MKINKSASRTIEVLSLLAKNDKPLTLTAISNLLGMPKTSTFELLYTLVEKGVVVFDNVDLKTFKLGIRIFEIGMAFLGKNELNKEARPFLEDLTIKAGETVFLAVEDSGSIVYVDRVESQSSITTTSAIGMRKPMYSTGLGKAMLAAYSNNRVEEIVGKESFLQLTQFTIGKFGDLVIELDRVRTRGYAIDYRESELDTACVAVPVYNWSDRPIAAISVASVFTKMDDDTIKRIGELIVAAAMNISKRLGFRRDRLYFDK